VFVLVSIPVLRCSVQGYMEAEKRVVISAGTSAARALNVWHDASERYPARQPFSGLADDDAPIFSKTREMSWHQTFSDGL